MIVSQSGLTGLPAIVTTVIPKGVAFSLVASAAGESWTVAEGVGVGVGVSVADAAAPPDVPVTYVLRHGATVKQATFLRGFTATHSVDTVLSSMDGRAHVEVLWEGDAGSSWASGVNFAQPLARRFPVATVPLVPAGPSWGIEASIDAVDVPAARRVLESGVVWVAHSHARCDEACTLPRVMRAAVDGSVTEGRYAPGRAFSVTVRQLDLGVSGVPVVTWGEASRAGVVWSPATTFATIRAQVGGA